MVAQLPIELLQLIVQDATPESLRSCRLVDRHWSAASTPYLFARFNVSLFSGPLANLTALSQSPLAKHVKAIDFHFDELPGYSREEWEGKLDSRPGFLTWRAGFSKEDATRATSRAYDALPKHDYTKVQLEAGWSTYQRYYEEQKRWADGQVGCVLRDGLSRFHNLNQVVVGRTKPFSDWEVGKQYWKHFMRDMLVKRDAWFYRKTLVKEYESLSRLLMTAAVGHRNSIPGMNPVQALEMELPEKFSFRDMIDSPPHCPLGHFGRALPGPTDPSERYAIVVEAFRPLRRLNLQCPSVPDDEDLENKSQIRELDSLLTAANGLEYLVLDFGEPGRSYENADVEDNHLDHAIIPILTRTWATFPQLRELKIMGSFPSESLLVFLAAHSSTLEFVGILDSFSDDWYKVLEYMGQLKLPGMYLECLWQPGPASAFGGDPDMLLPMGLEADDNFALAMKAYLLTGEGPVPRENDYES